MLKRSLLGSLGVLILAASAKGQNIGAAMSMPESTGVRYEVVESDEAPALFQAGMGAGANDGPFFTVDYLYWKPRRRALDFAIVDPNDQLGVEVPEGSIESLDWERRGGLRFGAGYLLPGSSFDIGAAYTYFHSSDDRSFVAPAGGVILPTLTQPGAVNEVGQAAASGGIDYDVIDLELGRRIHLCDGIAVRMFGGLRAAWIDQKFSALYDGGAASQDQVRQVLLFDGWGMRLGSEGRWELSNGFSVFTRASGSLLVGDFRLHLSETNNLGGTPLVSLEEKFEHLVPVFEAAAGLAWQWNNVHVSGGYEFVNWFDMVQWRDQVDDFNEAKGTNRMGNLGLDGFFLRIGLVR